MSLLLLVSAGFCSEHEETREFPVGSFTRVEIRSDRGVADFVGDTGPVAKVSWSKRTSSEGCNVGAVVEDGVLKLVNEKFVGGDGCRVDWAVRVPPGVPIDLKLGMSETNLSGLTGEVRMDVGTGKLVSNANLSKLTVNAGQLDGDVHDMAGDSIFDVGTGKLKMTWREIPPVTRNIALNFGSANAVISVPNGSTVNLDRLDTTPGFFGFGGFTKVSEFLSSAVPNFFVKGGGGTGSVEFKKNSA